MDNDVISAEETEGKDAESGVKVQTGDEELAMTKTEFPTRTGQPDNVDEEAAEVSRSVSVPLDGEHLCNICGFLAKCPRALKIHCARKHGKNVTKNTYMAEPPEDGKNISDMMTGEIEQKQQSEPESGGEEVRLLESDDGINTKGTNESNQESHEQQGDEDHRILSQERRVSKRTPKPKMIHSCNYCGQEFRDKAPLDVHVQRYHTRDTPFTFDADEDMDEEEELSDSSITGAAVQAHVALKGSLSRFQLKCGSCDYRVSTPASLESHTRVKHPGCDWYHCKLCHFYSATAEWMDAHLASDSHQQHNQREKRFEICIEKVRRDGVGDGAAVDDVAQSVDGEGSPSLTEGDQEIQEAAEGAKATLTKEDDMEPPPSKRRGRPKQENSKTCPCCGLVMSNMTNLSIHVRRKHSKEYGYNCTLCNYSCVTKGDMDRHCITKKHVKRAQECADPDPVKTQNHTAVQELNAGFQTAAKEQGCDNTGSQENSAHEQTQPDTSQETVKSDSIKACSQCDFVAQSMSSLYLHVKRRHTNDFEYACLACSYYAVTRREMSRHANTDKHKQKSQKYLEQVGSQEKRPLPLSMKAKEAIDVTKANPELCSLTETSCSEGNQSTERPRPAEQSVSLQAEDAAAGEEGPDIVYVIDGAEHEERRQERVAPSTSGAAQPANQTVGPAALSESQQACVPAQSEATIPHSDTQMSKAPPFDACIVSMKGLAEQEQVVQEDLFFAGESGVVCLAEGSPASPCFPSLSSPIPLVKKFNPKEVKVKEEEKGISTRIRCEDCGFLADGISGLNVHISMKHPTKDKHFHCLLCGKSFYTESNLHQHLTSAAHLRNEQNSVEELPEGGASFKCVKCTRRFQTEQELFVHIKAKHEELLRQVNKYVLEDTEQINREREENKGCVCKYCGKVCKNSNSMSFLAHIRTHTGSRPFKCKICDFAAAQLGDARNHVKRHLGMREYRCDICGWEFVMKKHLSTHLLGKHGLGQPKERKFECTVCERSFSEKWALNNHMKLHSGVKPYKCAWPSCHYTFLNLSAMKDHYRTHTGEKSYLCDLCGFAGGTKHALTKHRRQHTGERPFKCKLCNFASTTQSHLSRHNRVHTGEKPYRCPWCDYRSNCAENIRKHILHTGKHEGVKMYNCPKCDFATNAPMEFRNHLKDNHPDIENPDLAYLHAGIVSKSFDCRLKGQGAAFVEVETVVSPVHRKGPSEVFHEDEHIQQVIIIQGYSEGGVAIDQSLEASAAATLQTLAMAGQVAEVLHITEDGQVIASGREVASAGAHLAGGSTQYVVLESGQTKEELQGAAAGAARQSHVVSESSTALDALLSAVSEMGQQEQLQGEAAVHHEVVTSEVAVPAAVQQEVKKQQQEEEEMEVIQDAGAEGMQEVLQLAASQMMKEGLTQVIVNEEGTHYIVTELDNCTLQVEGGVYGEGGAELQQAEQSDEEQMVVYLDGASHNVVLEE
ncbi:zinc finger protein 407 isoform X2 [Thalassophryne amazonica]|uniref:zinc finger protein 407 isoform X2 n=1 Tax=Thalassophryne amazonica TaxID=390379 RepID=UPI00147169A7|nr:zinc finger protein 407 isoform X2 [Thalassophryne amazonica]